VTFPHTAVLGRIPGTTVYRNIYQYKNSEEVPGLLLVRLDAPLYFANAVYIRERLQDYVDDARK
jgi:MFS superfamily sulfate permease-like transporter